MRHFILISLSCALGLAAGQYNHQYSTTTPVPILKQINRHNEDGSYSYGYEAADGSYKIESKYPTGEVYGKYGFVDDSGSVREVEYGATKRGFEPSGPGINVPPSTLANENGPSRSNEPEDDGQYREDPNVYHTDPRYTNGERYDPVPRPNRQQLLRHQSNRQQQSSAIYNSPILRYSEYPEASVNSQPRYRSEYHQFPAAQRTGSRPEYRPEYGTSLQPAYEIKRYPQPVGVPTTQSRFQGHPASNIDLNLGSYTVNYRR